MTVMLADLRGLIPALGWTLAHFLWQGALVAFALQVMLKACRTSRARHDWALAALVAMAILPVATFAWLQSGVRIVLVPPGFPGLTPAGQQWETFAVALWLFGVAVLAARMAGGLFLLERLRRTAAPLPPDWAERCRRLEQRLATPLRVLFAQSQAVATPVVAGWLKPIVLIPAAMLLRLPAEELEALILHELAHVRRLDAFANLIQAVVETVLFYHPAVWWVSRRIRLEREQCCDELAAAAVGDEAVYVRALQSLDALRAPPYGVLAASGGDLKRRAARILGVAAAPERPALSHIAAVAVLALGAAAMTRGAAVQAAPAERPAPVAAARAAARPPAATAAAVPAPRTIAPAPRIILVEAPPSALAAPPVLPAVQRQDAAPAQSAPIQLALASAPPAQTVPSPTIARPSKPGDDAAIDHVAALFSGTGHGQVRLKCLIDIHGLAEHCEVVRETPAGKGFGVRAMQFPPIVRLEPAMGPDGVVAAYYRSFDISFEALATGGSSGDFGGSSGGGVFGPTVQHGLLARSAMLTAPVWATAPSFDDLAAAYPKTGGGVEGYVVLQCPVRLGALGKCRTIMASPEGRGFDAAAMRLAARFKLAPEQPGAPDSFSLFVDIPIRMPPPAALADRTVDAPIWLTGVDPRTAPKVFPPEAAAAGLTSGRGVARCTIGPAGVLGSCVAAPGAPGGLGFSQAAARLATGLRMTLWSADAAPVAGGIVDVPIRLNLKAAGT